ncbi:universal stress protein [Roseimicrobium gellanilyticum]|uniref:universal stress protein n=1 Tax=Roseimicrobium gellanilyticum TaxID=748857 RepID=UPI000DE92763|nr:universal stress protein [Roseimicrobium gellanilyticum]
MNTANQSLGQTVVPATRISRILAPTDFSPLSKAAVCATVTMLEGNPEASLTLMHAVDPGESAVDLDCGDVSHLHPLVARVNHAGKLMKTLRTECGCSSELDTRIVMGNAAHAICNLAREENYDLIVMSSHGRTGLARVLIGSVAERVVQEAPCAILVAKPPKDSAGTLLVTPVPLRFMRLLVGYDHRAGARHALDMAWELAKNRGSHLTLVHALEPGPVMPDCPSSAEERAVCVQEALERLVEVRRRRFPESLDWDLRVEIGEPWDVIVRTAKETCSDIVIVGPHEYTRWGHAYVGSTAQRVVRSAPCPVLVVK